MVEASALTESALVVPVPAAATVVHEHRLKFDPSAVTGVPDHITLLYPFLARDQLAVGVRIRLATLFSCHPRFEFQLTAIRWFGDHVMWLAPQPAEPFVHLTNLLLAEFGIPPYGGAYTDATPHLTVTTQSRLEDARQSAASIAAKLPINAIADRAYLMAGSQSTRWTLVDDYPYGIESR